MKDTLLKYRKELIFGLIVFWVALLSFGLGYLVARHYERPPIIIEKQQAPSTPNQ